MRNRASRVVIEYYFRAYSPPDDLEAFHARDCRITHADIPLTGDNLSDIRVDLQARGFEMHGARQTRIRRGGRYNPTWREVWVAA